MGYVRPSEAELRQKRTDARKAFAGEQEPVKERNGFLATHAELPKSLVEC